MHEPNALIYSTLCAIYIIATIVVLIKFKYYD